MAATNAILIIEDDADDGELLLRAFDGSRFKGRLALLRDGDAALKHLHGLGDSASDLPALVLLDLGLPKIGGLEVLRRMRAHPRLKYVPVVVLTSSEDDVQRSRALDSGASLFLSKPHDAPSFGKLARWVEDLLGFLD
jgi:CheY-like chemotaxis protein